MKRFLLAACGLATVLTGVLAAAWLLPVAGVPILGAVAERIAQLRAPTTRMDLVVRVPSSGPITFGELLADESELDTFETVPEVAAALSELTTEDKAFVFVHSRAEGARSTRRVSEALTAVSRAHLIFLVERPEDHPVP